MKVMFICRGNAFRSPIAEAYFKSMGLRDVTVQSVGTRAAQHREANVPRYRQTLTLLERHGLRQFAKPDFADQLTSGSCRGVDVAVCLNPIVEHEARVICQLPAKTVTWSVADIGEAGRIPHSASDRNDMMEQAFREIASNCENLARQLRLRT